MSESWSWCSSWKTAPPARTIPLQMFQCFNTTNQSFAVGSVFFFPHLKVETKQVNNHDRSLATPIPETTILPNDNEYTENDNEMTDSSKRIIDEQVTADTYLWIALASTPLAYQIQQKRITDLKEATKQTLCQKFEKSQQKLEQRFAEYALNTKVIVLVNFKLKTLVFLLHQSKIKRKIKKFECFLECFFQSDFCKMQLIVSIKLNLTVEKNKKFQISFWLWNTVPLFLTISKCVMKACFLRCLTHHYGEYFMG